MASDLGDLIRAEVARAESDFQGFRSRSLSIVAVAGGLVALVAGFLSVAAGSQKDVLPAGGEIPVLVALGSFVGATICALRINTPASIEATVPSELRTYVDDNWEADNWEQEVARFLLTYLESLRTANKTSATWLVAAIALEILGIASTAVMALLIVQHVS